MNKILLSALLVFILLPTGFGVEIIKTVSPSTVTPGTILDIRVEVINNDNFAISGTLSDLPPKFCEVLGVDFPPDNTKILENGSTITLSTTEVPVVFNVSLGPNERKIYSYQLKFTTIPDAVVNKPFSLSRALFTAKSGTEYYSTSQNLSLKTNETIVCNYNFECDEGENHENCFQDCLSGYEDDLCDGLTDYRCDPDCSEEEDPDCLNPTITNGLDLTGEEPKTPKTEEPEEEQTTEQDSETTQPDNTPIILIALILVIVAAVYFYKKK